MSNLPKQLKVGNLTYTVRTMPEIDRNVNEVGRSNMLAQEIQVDPAASPRLGQLVLLHEAVHQILELGCFHEETKNEVLVEHIAQYLFRLITENPEFIQELLQKGNLEAE